MSATPRYLAIRFDIDSITCITKGLPPLRHLGQKLGIPFTFYVNMGRSFDWRINGGLSKRVPPPEAKAVAPKLPLLKKLQLIGLLKTVFRNPQLGRQYANDIRQCQSDGHELGLHGGDNHVLWQHALESLDETALRALLWPAYQDFSAMFGQPAGFSCPGFCYNQTVFQLLEELGFHYSSDMPGVEPFLTCLAQRLYPFWQVPVNIIGQHRVALIEQSLAEGLPRRAIVEKVVDRIRQHRFALIYGHPYVEGVAWDILADIIGQLQSEYRVVSVLEYLQQWRAIHAA
jgi:peptidoglycan/xylan/chitin deacetylase (PgdA/CDA1 family)